MGLAAMAVVVSLFLFIGDAPVRRSQEARVAETARQMLGQPLQRWLIPEVNGETRLRKPPLAYWLSAASYKILGVGEGAARVPMVVAACVTALAACGIAAAMGQPIAGRWAGLIMLTTFMGFRWARLAETDMLAVMGLFTAWLLWLRAVEAGGTRAAGRRGVGWALGAGVALGVGFLSKQGPPFMIFGLLVASVPILRTHRPGGLPWRRIGAATGLMLLATVLTAGWWYYIALTDAHGSQLQSEAGVVARGQDHDATVLQYLPQFLAAMLPWTMLPVVAWLAWLRTPREQRQRPTLLAADKTLLLAFALTVVPLLFLGNRQIHYLLPLVPLGSILAGRLVESSYRWRLSAQSGFCGAMAVAVILMAAALPALELRAGRPLKGAVIAATIIAGSVGVVIFVRRRRGLITASAALTITAFAACWTVLTSRVLPEMEGDNARQLARTIAQAVGERPLLFLGSERSLPLCFALRREILPFETAKLEKREIPANAVLIDESPVGHPVEAAPAGYLQKQQIKSPKRVFTLYERKR